MSERRFFLEPSQINAGRAYLKDTDAYHVYKVLRLKRGDRIIVSDGVARSCYALLEQVDSGRVSCVIEGEITVLSHDSPRITLVQGLPKGDKMDLIVQKGVELGLHGIIPLLSERVVVRLAEEKHVKRVERWQRIAMEAAKQCRRQDIPVISHPQTWTQVLAEIPPEAVAIATWEGETKESLKSFMGSNQKPDAIYYFIGPEGGFSSSEIEKAREYGVRPLTMGPLILRTETAALAVAVMLLYQWGGLGGD